MTKKEDEPCQTTTLKDNLKNQVSNIRNRMSKHRPRKDK